MTSVMIAPPEDYTAPRDPALLGYPVTLALELALGTHTPKQICREHGITRDEFIEIYENPRFQAELLIARDSLQKNGMRFQVKAGFQAEAVLPRIWMMIHDSRTPPAVQADLAKFLVRCSGNDASVAASALAKASAGNMLNIQINMGG